MNLYKTKKGNMCKNPSHILNYGYCSLHYKDILPKDKYDLMCEYIFFNLQTMSLWRTKIFIIDISKKLLIQNPEIKKITEIQYYFLRYFHYYKTKNLIEDKYIDPNGIYSYYNLELPPKEWIKYCIQNKKII